MPINNPYIDLVADHPFIWTDTQQIYEWKNKWSEYFKNSHPIHLEIGTGMGNFFAGEVRANDDINYIGMEIKYKRLYTTAEKALGNKATEVYSTDDRERTSYFLLLKDYAQNVNQIFGPEEIQESYIFFPDPWGKKDRQKKHRLLQTLFLDDMYQLTKSGGRLLIQTDHREYFDFILSEVQATAWHIEKKSYDWESEQEYDSTRATEFQKITKKESEVVHYLELSKK